MNAVDKSSRTMSISSSKSIVYESTLAFNVYSEGACKKSFYFTVSFVRRIVSLDIACHFQRRYKLQPVKFIRIYTLNTI